MTYGSKILDADKKALNQGIAIRILDLMDKQRLKSKTKDSRRWIWELIQNAKDVSNEQSKVRIEINLDRINSIFEFSHNGKPFSSENITFLIKQVSSKDRIYDGTKDKTIGKFGTGFLTTHLLSEIVTINGILKEPNEPYKKINIELDRSGKDVETIIKSIESSFEKLCKIDSSPNFDDYNPNILNTKFMYEVDTKGINVAEQGIKELVNNIVYTLVFLPDVKDVYIAHLNIKFNLKENPEKLSENIFLHTITESNGESVKEHKIVTLSKDGVTIALEIEKELNSYKIKELNSAVPKLFCNFPLIGTESFPFPFIINSPEFNPTEPRDGIYLLEDDEEKVIQNQLIILEAQKLYYELLDFASSHNWGNMFLFATNLNSDLNDESISKKWVESFFVEPMRNKFLKTPTVDTNNEERISILDYEGKNNVWFPSHTNLQIRKDIWEICNYLSDWNLPQIKDIDNWYKHLWGKYRNLTLNELTLEIEKNKNVSNLGAQISGINVFEWINLYFKMLNDESKFIEDIIGDKFAVIPNQNGVFKKRTELNIDQSIEEELKNVMSLLGEDYREILLHQKIYTRDKIKYFPKTQEDIVIKINSLITKKHNLEACLYMISLFAVDDVEFPEQRREIYNFSSDIFKDYSIEERKITHWSPELWENVDKFIIENIVKKISGFKSLENFSLFLNRDRKITLNWLDKFVAFLTKNNYEYLVNNKEYPILPNQNGVFHIKDDLFLDDGDTEDILKDILKDLGLDVRDDLLCPEILLVLPENRTKTRKDIANEIIKLEKELRKEQLVKEDVIKAYKKLLQWFNENKEIAKDIFMDLYKNKHRLYNDEEIADNMEKVVKYDKLMDKFNIKDYQSLERILENRVSENREYQEIKQEITDELLIQLGIFSQSDLENALKNRIFSDNFIHNSEQNPLKFDFVQTLINRSIKNVFQHLDSRSEYDLSDKEEIAKTIYSINKNGEDIYIIIRPSDYDQVIIYYDSEKDLLDYNKDCELWIDDGSTAPQKITFGKILKITGVNKIPLKRI